MKNIKSKEKIHEQIIKNEQVFQKMPLSYMIFTEHSLFILFIVNTLSASYYAKAAIYISLIFVAYRTFIKITIFNIQDIFLIKKYIKAKTWLKAKASHGLFY